MKTLKKINLRGISETLNEKELKNTMAGSIIIIWGCADFICTGDCVVNGRNGKCLNTPSGCACANIDIG